jgi:hypothetical protein
LVFEKNANFSPKIGKIAENCDYNIDPWKVSGNPELFYLQLIQMREVGPLVEVLGDVVP